MNLEQLRAEARTGIVFSTPLVRATIRRLKTETSRVVPDPDKPKAAYRVGDILYIKETWQAFRYCAPYNWREHTPEERAKVDMAEWQLQYRAAYGDGEMDRHIVSITRWNSSRFMPRQLARHFIKIDAAEFRHLKSQMTEEWAIAEGTRAIGVSEIKRPAAWSEVQDFSRIWDKINPQFPFASNPLVAWYRFTPLEVES